MVSHKWPNAVALVVALAVLALVRSDNGDAHVVLLLL